MLWLPIEENSRCALSLARRMFHEECEVQVLPCSMQENGYDCGIYVQHFCSGIVQARLRSANWAHFLETKDEGWSKLANVSASEIHEHRRRLHMECVAAHADMSQLVQEPSATAHPLCDDSDCPKCGSVILGAAK